MDVHVVFGTGPVGLAVVDALVRRGQTVRVVNRRGAAAVPTGVAVAAGDVTDAAAVRRLCTGATTIYNCTNPPYTQWPELFPALNRGVLRGATEAGARLVVMDNLYMYGPTHGKALTEDLPYAATTRKGRVRAAMARELLAAHEGGTVRVAIGRASDFFGPGVRDSTFGERLFEPALASKPVQMIGNVNLLHTASYVPDIGEALVRLGASEQAFGRAWHLPAPATVTTRSFIEQVYVVAGTQPQIQAAPTFVVQAMGLFNPMMHEVGEMAYEFQEPHVLDSSAYIQAFGDHATPLDAAIRATVAWYRQQEHAAKAVAV